MLIPAENEKDLAEIPASVKEALEIVPVSHVDEVLARALAEPLQRDRVDRCRRACGRAAGSTRRVRESGAAGSSLAL